MHRNVEASSSAAEWLRQGTCTLNAAVVANRKRNKMPVELTKATAGGSDTDTGDTAGQAGEAGQADAAEAEDAEAAAAQGQGTDAAEAASSNANPQKPHVDEVDAAAAVPVQAVAQKPSPDVMTAFRLSSTIKFPRHPPVYPPITPHVPNIHHQKIKFQTVQ